ncbi:MAG: alginate lyase, partial [Congregibacter sp.]
TLQPLDRDATGVDWYPKPEFGERFGSGEVIKVSPGNNTLSSALAHAVEGDTLELSTGEYFESKVLAVDRAITIRAPQGAWIEYERPTLFEIQDGGSLWLDGVTVSGRSAPDYAGNSVIRTSRYGVLTNYEIRVDGSEFRDLNVNRSFHFLNANKSSLADHIQISDSVFQAISGSVLKLDRENDGFGIYSAEYITIRDSKFEDIQGPLVSLGRFGRDESTFGPHLTLTGSELYRVGAGQRSEIKASVYLHGVQVTTIADSLFEDSAPIAVEHTVGEPVTVIRNNRFQRTPEPTAVELVTGGPPAVSLEGNSFIAGEQ